MLDLGGVHADVPHLAELLNLDRVAVDDVEGRALGEARGDRPDLGLKGDYAAAATETSVNKPGSKTSVVASCSDLAFTVYTSPHRHPF